MAIFEGTTKEFIKFIGGYSRNKVQYISRKHRKKTGKCEECSSRTKKLDAAHIKGKERPVLIFNILNNYFIDNNKTIRIDLQEFEDIFVEAHEPIENTIRILCKDCHREYDSKNSVLSSVDENNDEQSIEEKEIQIIDNLINSSIINKSLAIQLINDKSNLSLDNQNSIFSNQNNSVNVWWLEPSNIKFDSEMNIILNDSNDSVLYHFKIPANLIANPEILFEQRKERKASKIIIPISKTEFKDKKGFDFKPYLIDKHNY